MEICRVGYALTPKKLKRGGIAVSQESNNYRRVVEWHGGGLADILESNSDDGAYTPPQGGVVFVPFTPECLPVRFDLFIFLFMCQFFSDVGKFIVEYYYT